MKAIKQNGSFFPIGHGFLRLAALIVGVWLGMAIFPADAALPLPGGTNYPAYTPIASFSFRDTNYWTSDQGYVPIFETNLSRSILGDGASLVIADTNPVYLNYPIIEPINGATNLVVGAPGSLLFWYAPSWASTNETGNGPDGWTELFDVGEWTTNAAYGCWSLAVDPEGENLWFVSQDALGDSYSLSTPISWTTNYFHFIALTYSPTNVSLYVDGELATNDPGGLSIWPDNSVLTNGFFIGSDMAGGMPAQGMFNTMQTYNYPLSSGDIENIFAWNYEFYILNPNNVAMYIRSATTTNTTFTPLADVITGSGNLQLIGSASSCTDGTNAYNVWITNVVATVSGSGSNNMSVTFSIEGGSNGVPFDVFANSVLSFGTNGVPWAWEGQGYQCTRYQLTGLPNTTCFLILGTPQDSDGDGLTDAYESLVSKSSPTNYSTDGSGMADGWEVLYFGHTGVAPNGDPDGDGLTTHQEWLMNSENYNPVKWNTFTNSIVGDGFQNYNGDGLANVMQASFGGNMLTNNPTWKINTSGDGLSDEYKTMAGLTTNSVSSVSGLPAYSKNPVP